MSIFVMLVSCLALYFATRLNSDRRKEYVFFLEEHKTKLGTQPKLLAKLVCWNAALGGSAPKWHWIPPVESPSSKY